MRDMTSNWSQCLGRLLRATGAGVIALSLVASGTALAGIANTRHNLSTTGPGGFVGVTAGTADICVFCHTPHAANLSVAAPLWNKQNSGATYTTFSTASSSTIDGTVLPVGSVSLACLSCHDGTQAMDNIINATGSGGLTADGGGAARASRKEPPSRPTRAPARHSTSRHPDGRHFSDRSGSPGCNS